MIFQVIIVLVGSFSLFETFNSRRSRKKYEAEILHYKKEVSEIDDKLNKLQKLEEQLKVVNDIEQLQIIVDRIKLDLESTIQKERNLSTKISLIQNQDKSLLDYKSEIEKIANKIENELKKQIDDKFIIFEGELKNTNTTVITLLKDRLNNFKLKYSDFFKRLSSEDEVLIPESSKKELSFISSLTEIPEILSINYFNEDELIFIGVAYYELKKFQEAISVFDKVITIQTKNPTSSPYSRKGVALLSIERYSLALVCFEKAISLNKKYYNAHYNKAKALELLNRTEEARQIYLYLIQENYNKKYLVLNSIGNLYFKQENYESALEHFLHSSKIKVNHPNSYYNASLASYNLKDKDNGLLYLQQAITINENLFNKALKDNDFIAFLDERLYALNPNNK